MTDIANPESVEDFTGRARNWLAAHMPTAPKAATLTTKSTRSLSDERDLARIIRCRELQSMLYEGGFAGICVPGKYGGQGLTYEHQAAFVKELVGYDYPAEVQSPTFVPCMAVLLEFGTEEQKLLHVPAILQGKELWIPGLSEPSGGSDVAGARTTAVRDGDEWILNGSKIWTTGAWWADWALCLARTNWDVPKHRGLTVFMLPIHQDGIDIQRIEMLNGSREFCQEFLTDVRIPDSDRVGELNDGWSVGIRWMYHERTISGGASPHLIHIPGRRRSSRGPAEGSQGLIRQMRYLRRIDQPAIQALIGEFQSLELVGAALAKRVAQRIQSRQITDQSAAITRLFSGTMAVRNASIAFQLGGQTSVAWAAGEEEIGKSGIDYLMRQASCIGGGTTEMSRNVISERVLGMPRDRTPNSDGPFRNVPSGPASS